MNKRQVIVFWVIAVILAAAVALLTLTRKDTAESANLRAPGATLFESFPATDVVAVEITGADGSINLAKKDGTWVLAERDDFPANATTVNDFLRTLNDLKVIRGIEAGPSFAPRFGMDESSADPEDRGLTAVFKDVTGKEIARVSLGKNIESGQDSGMMMGGMGSVGRYIRNHADESGFYAVSEMFPAISAEPQRWLSFDFFSPEKIQSISLSQKGSDETEWKVVRESEEAEFKLDGATGAEVLDSTAAAPFKSLFSFLRFDDVVPAAEVEAKADAENTQTAIIETFEGFRYTVGITPIKDSEDKVLMTVEVTAEIPEERKKGEDEKEEDAEALDQAFEERTKTLREKLEKESKFAGRSFELFKSSVDTILKERSAIVTQAVPPEPGEGGEGTIQELPGGAVVTPPPSIAAPEKPPVTAVTPPIEAVTPPIAIPPLEEDDDDDQGDHNEEDDGSGAEDEENGGETDEGEPAR